MCGDTLGDTVQLRFCSLISVLFLTSDIALHWNGNVLKQRSSLVTNIEGRCIWHQRLNDITAIFLFQTAHTILLVQPKPAPESKTYSDYETVKDCLEGEAVVHWLVGIFWNWHHIRSLGNKSFAGNTSLWFLDPEKNVGGSIICSRSLQDLWRALEAGEPG